MAKDKLPLLPDVLEEAYPTTKLLYLWLLPQGVVRHSQRSMAKALFTEPYLISRAIKQLRDCDLLEDIDAPEARKRTRFRVKP